MQFKLNPITGDLDRVSGNWNYIQKINPVTGKFNLVDDADSYKQIINPLTGNFQLWPKEYIKEVTWTRYIDLTDAVANSLISLKLFWWIEQRNIPKEYTQVEYLESSGTQYIDTGILHKNLIVEYEALTTETSSASQIFLATSVSSNWVGWRAGRPSCWAGINVNATKRRKYKATYTSTDITLMDIETGLTDTTLNNYIDKTLYLFSYPSSQYPSYTQLFSCKMYEGTTLVRNLVPCKRNSDNVLGMYDTVSGNFLTNAGTGTFIAGANVVPTPETPMNIVCNNGVLKVSPNLFYKNQEFIDGYVSAAGKYTIATGTMNTQRCFCIECKPNTTYTLSGMTADSTWGSFEEVVSYADATAYTTNNGTITTGANDKYLIGLAYTTDGRFDYRNTLQIEEGSTATAYMPYGQIYTDGTVETVEVHGKNLLNEATATLGNMRENGEIAENVRYRIASDYIPVKPNTDYTISGTISDTEGNSYAARGVMAYYTANKTYIENTRVSNVSSFTTPNDSSYAYIRIVFCNTLMPNTSVASIENSKLQLEYGSTATDYEPYYYGGSATAEMLLKIWDYADEQEILSWNITRKVGIKVLDWTESWNYYSVTQGSLFRTKIADGLDGVKDVLGVLCNYYNVVSSGSRADGTLTGTAQNYDFINNNYSDLTGWKQYLKDLYNAGNPIIVVYPLATPTTETVTGQQLDIQKWNNIIEITQASIDNLELSATYKSTAE